MKEERKKQVRLSGEQVLLALRNEQTKLEALRGKRLELERLLAETIGAEESLKEISEAKEPHVMVSLGAGIYAEARLDSNKMVKAGFGGGVLLTTSIGRALEDLAKRKEGIQRDIASVQREEMLALQNVQNLALAVESARQRKATQA